MATRTLESRRDRLTTMLVLPLVSCGARLLIYALIIPAFFPSAWHAPMLWIIYLTGMLLAIVCAKILRSTLFKGETVPFVMELPPYRLPTFKGVMIHMWERGESTLQPQAWNLELAYPVLDTITVAAKYEGTKDWPDVPESQFGVAAAYTLAANIGIGIEYLHGTFDGSTDDRDMLTLQIAVEL